jgi:hypothetical protein
VWGVGCRVYHVAHGELLPGADVTLGHQHARTVAILVVEP